MRSSFTPELDAELREAVLHDDVSRVRDLLGSHPELRARLNDPIPEGAFGSKIMHLLAKRQQRDMIDLMIEYGADINQRTDWWAGSFGVLDDCDVEFAPFLIMRGAVVDAHSASRLGMVDRLRELLRVDPSLVRARGGDGQTPLHFARNIEIALLLLDHQADVNAMDVDHESTPAQWMIRDRTDVARFLVRRGSRTDILLAAALGDDELVRHHLAENPQAIRARVASEFLPMRDPRAGGSIYTWTLGAGKSVHVIAREFGHHELFEELLQLSPQEVQLAVACETGDQSAVDALLELSPDVAKRLTVSDYRRLPEAANNNAVETVRLMLAAGWPVDARDEGGATALHYASWLGNADLVREILRYQPSLGIRETSFNGTPIDWAQHGSLNSWRKDEGDYAGVVRELRAAGAVPPPATGG